MYFAHASLSVLGQADPMEVSISVPVWSDHHNAWGCHIHVGEPIALSQEVFGEHGLQAISLGLKILSTVLYGSTLYKDRKLGAFGEFGGDLGLPARKEVLKGAPYPF